MLTCLVASASIPHRFASGSLSGCARFTPLPSPSQIILSCLFHYIEGFCPSDDSSEDFQTFLAQVEWQLPKVVFDWTASPPPPPGILAHGPLAELALQDPEGLALAEQALNDFFPPLSQVVSVATGSRIAGKYGPKYVVSKWETSVAFLATESFADKESLAARMIQARFSGYGRFSCMAMLEYASTAANAAAGSAGPQAAQLDNPPDFAGRHDRNWVLYWAILFTASLEKETGVHNLDVNVLDFWAQQCEEPASYKAPVEPAWYNADRKRLGNQDAFLNEVDMRDFAPLVSFGSLRQLRATEGAAVESYPEDATTVYLRSQNERYAATSDAQMTYEQSTTRNMYGRRAEELAPATPPRRKLFVYRMIANLISKSLGVVNQEADKEFPFVVPSLTRPHFFDDHVSRQHNHFKEMLKLFCDPDERLDIENVVGNPPPFEDPLYDTRTTQTLRDLITPASMRDGDPDRVVSSVGSTSRSTYRDYSTQQWVYVTSSDDPGVSVGFHRLAEIRAWPDLQCDEIKSQPCGSLIRSGSGSSSAWTFLSQLQQTFSLANSWGRRLSSAVTHFVANPGIVERASTSFRTGIEALLAARCSSYLYGLRVPHAQQCTGSTTAWYRDSGVRGCSASRVELQRKTTFLPASSYLSRFAPPAPPPTPPPKPPPPLPPGPPPPRPPPRPPRFDTRDAALGYAKETMRNFCDTVYIVSEETRCTALALNLHSQFQLAPGMGWDPPALPPAQPGFDPPPPPPAPPSPLPPLEQYRHLYEVLVTKATLSTLFVPTVAPAPPPSFPLSANLARVYAAREQSLRAAELAALAADTDVAVSQEKQAQMLAEIALRINDRVHLHRIAACSASLAAAGAPLPCRTSVLSDRCIDLGRRCGSAYSNALEPYVELDFANYADPQHKRYFFSVTFRLPAEEEYGRLFFHSLLGDVQENRGWRLTLYDAHHAELAVQCQEWVHARETEHVEGLRDVHHGCLGASASPSDYAEVARARHLRVTLVGEWRQIWLDEVHVYFRDITNDAAFLLPPPPGSTPTLPPAAPDPPAPPPAACDYYANRVFQDWYSFVEKDEGCAHDYDTCCAAAHEHAAAGFVLSASGCCQLVGQGVEAVPTEPYQESFGPTAGAGVVVM